MKWGCLEVSGGFLLLAAFLYYMDTQGVVLWGAAACALHEAGHYLAIRLLGGRVAGIRLTCVGAEMRLSANAPNGRMFRVLTALAGPAANLAAAAAITRWGDGLGEERYLLIGLNLSLGLFNLLPISGLDGGRILRTLLEGGDWKRSWGQGISLALALGLGGAGIWLLLRRGNPTLLLTGGWLGILSLPEPCSGGRGELRRKPLQSRKKCDMLQKSE